MKKHRYYEVISFFSHWKPLWRLKQTQWVFFSSFLLHWKNSSSNIPKTKEICCWEFSKLIHIFSDCRPRPLMSQSAYFAIIRRKLAHNGCVCLRGLPLQVSWSRRDVVLGVTLLYKCAYYAYLVRSLTPRGERAILLWPLTLTGFLFLHFGVFCLA